MPIKVLIALIKTARWIPLWLLAIVIAAINGNISVLFLVYDNDNLVDLALFLIGLAAILWFFWYYAELELWEIKNDRRLDYQEEVEELE